MQSTQPWNGARQHFRRDIPAVDCQMNTDDPRLPAGLGLDDLDPFTKAAAWFLCTLGTTWQAVADNSMTAAQDDAIDRMVAAGLVEAHADAVAKMKDRPEVVYVRCVVCGGFHDMLLDATIKRQPSWLRADGATDGHVDISHDFSELRLTEAGEHARADLRSSDDLVAPIPLAFIAVSNRIASGRAMLVEHHVCLASPPKGGHPRARMSKTLAEAKARTLMENDRDFALLPLRTWATKIGCSEGQVGKLALWKATKSDRKADRTPKPREVSCGDTLQDLIADQANDQRSSSRTVNTRRARRAHG